MKRSLSGISGLLAATAIFCGPQSASAEVINFQDLTLSAQSYYNGSDNGGGFTSGGASFNNSFTDFGGGFTTWGGWAYSNTTDIDTKGFGNQYSAYNDPVGDGTNIYGIGFFDTFTPINPMIVLPDGARPASIQITNNTYTALSMREGDSFAKKFGGINGNDPDFLLLTISGYDSSNQLTGSVDFYLADYRFDDNAFDYIVQQWIDVDLSPLGDAHWLSFSLETSDVGFFGPNTPFYFAADNLQFQYAAVPEPSSLVLLGVAAAGWSVRRWRKKSAAPAENV